MEVAAAALRDGWRAGRTVSCLSIHWLIDWFHGAVLLQERATPSLWVMNGWCLILDFQTKCQTHLCVFVVRRRMCTLAPAQHVQIKILTLNKRLRPARCAPVIIRSLPGEDALTFRFGGWGRLFPVGTYPVGLTPPLLHQEFPSSQWLCPNEFTEY